MIQKTLMNENIGDDKLIPITMEIVFEIKENSLWWEGKAYPNVSSGCIFGGAIKLMEDYKNKINQIVSSEIDWLIASYNRAVKKKITIMDKRIGEKNDGNIIRKNTEIKR